MPRKKAAPKRNVATAADAKRAREEADKAAADAARKRARSDKDAWAFKQNVTSVDAPLRDTDGDGVEVARLVGVRDTGDASASFSEANPTRIALEVSGDRVKTARLAWRFAGEDDENEDAWRPERAPSLSPLPDMAPLPSEARRGGATVFDAVVDLTRGPASVERAHRAPGTSEASLQASPLPAPFLVVDPEPRGGHEAFATGAASASVSPAGTDV